MCNAVYADKIRRKNRISKVIFREFINEQDKPPIGGSLKEDTLDREIFMEDYNTGI